MRLISNFKDYYDSTLISFEKDPQEKIFVRNSRTFSFQSKNEKTQRLHDFVKKFTHNTPKYDWNGFHSMLCIAGRVITVGLIPYRSNGWQYYNNVMGFEELESLNFCEQYLKNIPRTVPIEAHIEAESPIFRISSYRDTVWHKHYYSVVVENNFCLRDFELHKVFDAFTVGQMIEQYLTNEMANAMIVAPRPITDAERAATHGFDKHSFRKLPIKK